MQARGGTAEQSLGGSAKGFRGIIRAVRSAGNGAAANAPDLERRLLELGFVEGARVEILHQGLFGRDPIAVRIADATIALRRREANAIMVEPLPLPLP